MDDWRPTASWRTLSLRAALIAQIRGFFGQRGVLEVETPLLSAATVSDPHLASLQVCPTGSTDEIALYLQTSPESAMKRLVAAGSGAIYEICRAFRAGEAGRRHNPEFTILEWYRPGFDHHALMSEIDELLALVLAVDPARRITYRQAFERHAGIDPHTASAGQLRQRAQALGLEVAGLDDLERDSWLDLLLTQTVEPHLGRGRPTFVLDFPANQAALARVRPGDPPLAERFELFVEGIELANGYHELADAGEQRQRYELDLQRRHALGLPPVPPDNRLLAALDAGLGQCAGVAMGIDRLVMLAVGASSIEEVIPFPITRA